jgi:predicted site-specific integrase-resolvase
MATKLLSVKECKEIYGLSRGTLINYEKKGFITPIIYGQKGSKNK